MKDHTATQSAPKSWIKPELRSLGPVTHKTEASFTSGSNDATFGFGSAIHPLANLS